MMRKAERSEPLAGFRVLDLKQEEGCEALYRLVETTDVLVHNFRPSVPTRRGIGLREINSRLICG